MRKLEKALQIQHEEKTEMLKKMAFFIELEGFKYDVWAYPEVELIIDGIDGGLSKDGLSFKITAFGDEYTLQADYYESDSGDNLCFEKIKRKTAKSIVSNIIKIDENIDQLAQEQHVECVERYEERQTAAEEKPRVPFYEIDVDDSENF